LTIFNFENIYKAYQDCLKNKKNTVNALKFEMKREENLFSLLDDLKKRKYKISRHICFIVVEPSPREVFAAHFRDRVVHHLLCNEIEKLFEQIFLENSYANRKRKGTHKAVKKLQWYVRRGGIDGKRLYFLKLDIKSFFRSINKEILWQLIKKHIHNSPTNTEWKEEILWLTKKIIFHNPTNDFVSKVDKNIKGLLPKEKSLLWGDQNTGLPIGNLTSQFFANVYLNELDHFAREQLGFDRYLRYVDDFVILDENYDNLFDSITKINNFLDNNLNLKLCSDKTKMGDTKNGVDFLGYFIKPTHTLVRKKVVKRFKMKLYCYQDSFEDLNICIKNMKYDPIIQSYLGHFSHANSFNLVNKLFNNSRK